MDVVSTVNVVKVVERQLLTEQVAEFLAKGGTIKCVETSYHASEGEYFLPVANTEDIVIVNDLM